MSTAGTIMVARESEIPAGGMKRFVDGDLRLLVVRCDDRIYVVDDTCTHEEASLSEGILAGCEIECPLHGARFDVRSGEVVALPALVPLRTYPVTVANGEVHVEVD